MAPYLGTTGFPSSASGPAHTGDRLGAPRWETSGLHAGSASSRSWTSTAEGSTEPGRIALLNSFCSIKARLVSIPKAKPAGDGDPKPGWVSGHPATKHPREPRWLGDAALNPEQQFLRVRLPYGEEIGSWAQSWTQRSQRLSHSHPAGRRPRPVPIRHDKIPGELQTAVAGAALPQPFGLGDKPSGKAVAEGRARDADEKVLFQGERCGAGLGQGSVALRLT